MKSLLFWLSCLISLNFAAGCVMTGTNNSSSANLTERYAMPGIAAKNVRPPEGSIYNADDGLDLYQDKRARRVGDIVLVKIVETSSGAKKAETTTERQSTTSAGISSLFGFEQWYGDKNRYFAPSMNVTTTNDFEGTGETKRNSTVTATLSARVIEETLDGNLVIRGYREVRVNNETQHIILSGIIRPQDISADNSILSSYIADARIEYSGTGVVADKQQPGWLARVFDVIWPF